MRLPGLDGFELQRLLITRPRRIPVVFVSAHEDAVIQANALRAGAIAYLKKPFDNSTLLDAVHRAVR
jgi:FixJ family two-component response regulator